MNIDTLHLIGEICGFIGGAIGIATGLPQALRVRKLGHTEGLELSPWILMFVMYVGWTAFGLNHNAFAIWFFNALTVITTSLVIVAIRGNKFSTYLQMLVLALVGGAFVFYGPEFLVNLVLLALTASRLPQLIRTCINRARVKPTAVSISSLTVALVSQCFWMSYAILTNTPFVILSTGVAMALTVSTAVLESRIAARAAATR